MSLAASRFCSIDFLNEQIPNWKALDSIFISNSIRTEMEQNPFFKQDGNIWTREELSDQNAGKYYPRLSYELRQIRCDLWMIQWIELDGSRRYFTSNPVGNSLVV